VLCRHACGARGAGGGDKDGVHHAAYFFPPQAGEEVICEGPAEPSDLAGVCKFRDPIVDRLVFFYGFWRHEDRPCACGKGLLAPLAGERVAADDEVDM
jgi:hypothetical protein